LKEKQVVRIGVLGCGPISQAAHFEACHKARNAELYAICDVAEDLLARMAAIHEPNLTYSNYDDMLADPNVDAVVIGIADQFHVQAAQKALQAGKHVLVEKPLGVSIEECEALAESVHTANRILQVGTMKRFDPGISFAHQFIENEIGQMLALKAWYCDSTYRYFMTDNVQPPIITSKNALRPAGNPKADKSHYYLLTHGSHLVDTVRFLGGEIISVQARQVVKFDAYCWFVAIEFANGSLGILILPWRSGWIGMKGSRFTASMAVWLAKPIIPGSFAAAMSSAFQPKMGNITGCWAQMLISTDSSWKLLRTLSYIMRR